MEGKKKVEKQKLSLRKRKVDQPVSPKATSSLDETSDFTQRQKFSKQEEPDILVENGKFTLQNIY